jgi:tRNA (adenine57-N1/adenine58-N1)-methyltransferase catalytic subunit
MTDPLPNPTESLPHTAGGAPHTPPRGPFRAGDRVQLTGP